MGEYFLKRLMEIKNNSNKIKQIRGKGLMVGIEFGEEIAKEINNRLFEAGYLTGVAGTKILRLLPPLIVNRTNRRFC